MVNEYVSPVTGRHLEKVSAEALWSGLLQQNRKRFGKSTVETTKVRACPPAPSSRCAHP